MGIRINGISIPVGGISWEYTESEKKWIQEMFYYLESKRILTNPIEMEIKEWSEKSAIEIKNKLVEILSRYKYDQITVKAVKDMIDACNKFLDDMQKIDANGIIYKNSKGDWCNFQYSVAMKKFREVFRKNIQLIEGIYEIHFSKEIPKEY